MNLNVKRIKAYAYSLLSDHAAAARRMVLIFVLTYAAVQLLSLVVGQVLILQADKLTSLSSMGTRNMLITAQQVMSFAVSVLTVLWSCGYFAGALAVARNQEPGLDHLMQPLRRPGKYIVMMLLLIIRVFLFIYLTVFALALPASFLLSATVQIDPSGLSDEALIAQLEAALAPMITPISIGILVVALVVAFFVLFRYRLAFFIAADHPELRAGQVLRLSSYLMRGVWGQFLKLDFSFWWYYLALAAAAAINGVTYVALFTDAPLPFGDWFFVIVEAVYIIVYSLVLLLCHNRVQVTYAATYAQLSQAKEIPGMRV